jgi:hypothetical protein
LEFQPLLCDAMLQLSAENRRISQERNALIAQKKTLKPIPFVKRQRTLGARQIAIRQAMGIGQALGNSFAWFFYQWEPGLLEEHAKHDRTDSLHAGIGGIGEREFIKGFPALDGKMVLHHGTTTMLRIGDLSFIDLKTFRVVGLGELKTERSDAEHLSVTLFACGTWPIGPGGVEQKSISRPLPSISHKVKERLGRQFARMANTIKARNEKNPSAHIQKREERNTPEFGELLQSVRPNRLCVRQLDDGLLCAVYRHPPRSLLTTTSQEKPPAAFYRQLPSIIKPIERLLKPGSTRNAMMLSNLFFSEEQGAPANLHGTAPLFWWDIDLESIRSLVFREIFAFTAFNPAHFISKLEAKGFTVNPSPNHRDWEMSMKVGESQLQIKNASYFVHLITHSLFTEDFVVQLVEDSAAEAKMKAAECGKNVRVDLKFNHTLWRDDA